MDWSNKYAVLEAVKKDGSALQFASTELQADKDVVLEAVMNDGSVLCFASDELLADKDVVLEAVMDDGSTLEFASEELLADKDVVLKALKNDGSALQYASKELQADKDVVLDAVKQNGYALRFASEELQTDKEVVLEAVKTDGYALQFTSTELQADKDVVLDAVMNDGSALRFASDELLANKNVVSEAVKKGGYALRFASEELQTDKDVVLEAVKQNGKALEFASEELQTDKEIVLEAVKQDGYALQYASEELQADKDVVIEAVKQKGYALQYANEKIQKEVEEVGGLEKWIKSLTSDNSMVDTISNQNNKDDSKIPNVKAIHMLYENKALLELKRNEATPFVVATCVNSLNTENFIEWSSGQYFCDKSGAENEMVQYIIQSTISKEKYSENEILGVCRKIFELNMDMDYLDYGSQEESQEKIYDILTSGEPTKKEAIFASVIEQCNLANTDEAVKVMLLLNSMQKITEEKEREIGIDVTNYLENAEISTKGYALEFSSEISLEEVKENNRVNRHVYDDDFCL